MASARTFELRSSAGLAGQSLHNMRRGCLPVTVCSKASPARHSGCPNWAGNGVCTCCSSIQACTVRVCHASSVVGDLDATQYELVVALLQPVKVKAMPYSEGEHRGFCADCFSRLLQCGSSAPTRLQHVEPRHLVLLCGPQAACSPFKSVAAVCESCNRGTCCWYWLLSPCLGNREQRAADGVADARSWKVAGSGGQAGLACCSDCFWQCLPHGEVLLITILTSPAMFAGSDPRLQAALVGQEHEPDAGPRT